MELKIITPERIALEAQDAEHVLLPAENGQVGILPGHIAMMCSLKVGRIHVDLPDGSVDLATSGGFAEVLDDRITVLADTAERAADIDVERAQSAMTRAQERLRQRDEKTDDVRAQTALARALNRIEVARRH